MHRVPWPVAVVSILLACSPISGPSREAPAPIPNRVIPISRAIWQALAAFDSAARAGDTSRLAAVFAEDAVVISAHGDSIRGRDAVAHYLTGLVPEAHSVSFSFGLDSFERCRKSARARLSYNAHVTYARAAPDTVSGIISVFWRRNAAGRIEVAWVAFSEDEIRRRLRTAECPPREDEDSVRHAWQGAREDSVWHSYRMAVSLFPAVVGITSTRSSFAGILRARGWDDESCSCLAPPCLCFAGAPGTPLSHWTWLPPPSLVGLEHHLPRRLVAEFVATVMPGGSTMGAKFQPYRNYAQTRLSYSGAVVGSVLSCERGRIRFGIGPALQVARWRLSDSLVDYSSGGSTRYTSYRWSTFSVGIIGDVQYRRLLTKGHFLSVRAQVRRFRKSTTPATPRFPEAKVDQGGSFVGVGWGVVF